MNYWPAKPLSLEITTKRDGPGEIVDLDRPYGLIGSHSQCNVRIRTSDSPRAIYAAFSFPDRIEVWPLGPVAFPVWGTIGPQEEISIGSTRVKVDHQQQDQSVAGKDFSFTAKRHRFKIIASENDRSIVLERQVNILGGAHPSTIRIHGAGLAACQIAVVAFDQGCWLVPLDPNAEGADPSEPIFLAAGDQVKIGKLTYGYDVDDQDAAHRSDDNLQVETTELSNQFVRQTNQVENRLQDDDITPDQITQRLVSIQRQRKRWFSLAKVCALVLLVGSALFVVGWVLSVLIPLIAKIYGFET